MVFESEFAVLNADNAFGLDCIRETELFFVPSLVCTALSRPQVDVQEFVFADTIDVDVQVDGSVPILEFLEANLYGLLYYGFILVIHDNQSFISENKYNKNSELLQWSNKSPEISINDL